MINGRNFFDQPITNDLKQMTIERLQKFIVMIT